MIPKIIQGSPLKGLLFLKAASGNKGITVPGPYVSFSAEAAEALKGLRAAITAVQAGTGDPSSENIRPLSGFTGCSVKHCGKNLYDISSYPLTQGKWINGGDGTQSNNASYASTTDFIPLVGLDGVKITLNKRPGGGSPGIAFYSGNTYNTFVGGVKNNSGTAGEPITVTVPAGARYFRFTVPADATDIQVEIGESSTAYEAFTGDTDTATWEGTVYGGSIDWKTGKLRITHGYIDSYAGEALPGSWVSDRDVYAAGATPTTGAQVVYQLAEPVTVTVADVPEVSTLAGVNVMAADTGIITVTYAG